MRRAILLTAVPVVVSLALSACGGSTSGGYGSASATSSVASSAVSTASAAAQPVALISAKSSKLGTILAYGPQRLTVYLFEADHGDSSSCSGACAQAWPPVTGRPQAGAGVNAGELGTIRRSDGSSQVTYNGHPLYLFVNDNTASDTLGEGLDSFGAPWYALSPSGSTVKNP